MEIAQALHNVARHDVSCARPLFFPRKASTEYFETQRRYNYVTPKSYLELIGFYKFLLDQKRTEVQRQIDRLDVGLSTLRKTAADVAELQVDLTHTMVKVSSRSFVLSFRFYYAICGPGHNVSMPLASRA